MHDSSMLIEKLQKLLLFYFELISAIHTPAFSSFDFLWLGDNIFHIQKWVSAIVSVEQNLELNAQWVLNKMFFD